MEKQSLKMRLWKVSILIGFIIFAGFLLLVMWMDDAFTWLGFAKSLSGTAAIMIGLSFVLSSLAFYFKLFDTKIVYRKYFGLVGYYFALVYSAALLFLFPEKYFYGLIGNLSNPDIYLGLIAMTILTLMAIISNTWATVLLGPKLWRKLLRLGYIAWFILVIRAYIIEGDVWIYWLFNPDGLPPGRLVLSAYVIAIILLRVSIEFVKLKRKKN